MTHSLFQRQHGRRHSLCKPINGTSWY